MVIAPSNVPILLDDIWMCYCVALLVLHRVEEERGQGAKENQRHIRHSYYEFCMKMKNVSFGFSIILRTNQSFPLAIRRFRENHFKRVHVNTKRRRFHCKMNGCDKKV